MRSTELSLKLINQTIMREIKFRFWHPTKKGGYIHDEHFVSADGQLYESGYNGAELVSQNFKNDVIMQYSGLKDKRGKEIYEGDLLKIHAHWDKFWTKNLKEVIYEDGSFFPFGSGDWTPDLSNVEIVGNVYENPELLTKQL